VDRDRERAQPEFEFLFDVGIALSAEPLRRCGAADAYR
jgi:hypothetical protein